MLGFDALGRQALGQVPSASTTPLVARMAAMAQLRATNSPIGVLQGRADGSAALKAQMTSVGIISARANAKLSARVPGGIAIKGRITAAAKANVSPGYLLFARAMMASSALSDIHIEGKTTAPRNPLLLDSSSPLTASYWKGRS